MVQTVKTLPTVQEIEVQSWGWGNPREKGVAPHSRILAWKIPWTEEPHRIFFCFLAFEKSASRIYVHMFLSELLFPLLPSCLGTLRAGVWASRQEVLRKLGNPEGAASREVPHQDIPGSWPPGGRSGGLPPRSLETRPIGGER